MRCGTLDSRTVEDTLEVILIQEAGVEDDIPDLEVILTEGLDDFLDPELSLT